MTDRRILIVDDELSVRGSLEEWFREDGFRVETAEDGPAALRAMERGPFDIVLLDLKMPGMDGIEVQKRVRDIDPAATVIILTAYASVETAVAALKLGAYDYVTKPVDPDDLSNLVRNALTTRALAEENARLKEKVSELTQGDSILAVSARMQHVLEMVRTVAATDSSVVIRGESGTGKELVARAIHVRSGRVSGPFVPVHTGALPRELIASELFGHERGSFTGAVDRKEGKFEQADGGTIFLDEISTMDERTQVNLLRVLETFTFARIGGKKEKQVNVRVVAATNSDLMKLVESHEFREDLYYRLNILNIVLPPLRERAEDIPVLADEFRRLFAERYKKQVEIIPAETQRLLEGFHWPGNVRELRNVMEQGVLLARGRTFDPELLPQIIYRAGPPEEVIRIPLGSTMKEAERELILRTLEAQEGNKKITAEILGISRRSLYNKLAEYGIETTKRRST